MRNRIFDVVIIGAGASGLAASVCAARRGLTTAVLEQNDGIGRKLLATGNGRCNFTNSKMEPACYKSETPDGPEAVLQAFGWQDSVSFLDSLGIAPYEKDGYYYPASLQAASVTEVFYDELTRLSVTVYLKTQVLRIQREADGFCIFTAKAPVKPLKKGPVKSMASAQAPEKILAKNVILSCGSRAGIAKESTLDGYALAKSFGHHLTPLAPALVPLVCEPKYAWGGVRVHGRVTVQTEHGSFSDTGELQLTDYGISGIPVFQVSRHAALAGRADVSLDFFPEKAEEDLVSYLQSRHKKIPDKNASHFLDGLVNNRLIPVLLLAAGLQQTDAVTDALCKKLAKAAKNLPLTVTGTKPLESAQVCAGGVRLSEICLPSMESRLVRGLYITGEMLDADGLCGGYNLQWAWATGYLAGRSVCS